MNPDSNPQVDDSMGTITDSRLVAFLDKERK